MIALRTQQIVAYESGIADTADPLAGSYFVEELTNKIYEKAKKYITRIDELGGMVEAIEKGFVQQEIQDSAYAYQLEVEKGEQVVVGVNKFQIKEDPPSNLLKVDPSIQVSQIAKINDVKASRDNDLVKVKLAEIKKAAQSTENLMPKILEAVKAYATLGEITGTMQEVFGEHKESVVL
jgi:methylmalonyl-CoA mutase N-terminal domain/subunit